MQDILHAMVLLSFQTHYPLWFMVRLSVYNLKTLIKSLKIPSWSVQTYTSLWK